MEHFPTVREMLLELQHQINDRLHSAELQSQDLQGRLTRVEESLARYKELQETMVGFIGRLTRVEESLTRHSADVATAKQRTDDLDLMRYEIRQIQEQLAAGETSRRDLGLETVKIIIGLALGAIAAVLLGGGLTR